MSLHILEWQSLFMRATMHWRGGNLLFQGTMHLERGKPLLSGETFAYYGRPCIGDKPCIVRGETFAFWGETSLCFQGKPAFAFRGNQPTRIQVPVSRTHTTTRTHSVSRTSSYPYLPPVLRTRINKSAPVPV